MRACKHLARVCIAVSTLLGTLPAQQQDVAPELLLLQRIKHRVRQNLRGLPNYTCTQTIERSRRLAPSKRFQLVDVIRLEVALVAGNELFSWPGAMKFEDTKITDMVSGGAIGNGNFALHVQGVFLSSGAAFTWVGERIRDGRRTYRYDYEVPLAVSGYNIRMGEVKAMVGYRGSFWVDAESLDLTRLEVVAHQIPPHLPLTSASDTMEYQRVPIGAADFLLPKGSELTMIDIQGNESFNRTSFRNCRQYTGESKLTFEDPPPDEAPGTPAAVTVVEIPEGLKLETQLLDKIDSATHAVGDPIRAKLSRALKVDGRTLMPKGAILTGRIMRLGRQDAPVEHYIVRFEFFTLESGNLSAEIRGIVRELTWLPIGIGAPGSARYLRRVEAEIVRRPGDVVVAGTRVRLHPGVRIAVETVAPSAEEQK